MTKAATFAAMLFGAGACAGARGDGSAPAQPKTPETLFAGLPRNVRVAEVVPGRFASTFDFEDTSSCSMSWSSTSSRATVVLDLATDGRATGCRGRHYLNTAGPNDSMGEGGSHPARTTEYVEQQGMRGRWRRQGRTIVVDLDLDATVCPSRAEGIAPRRWRLRCAALEPAAKGDRLRAPVLACALLDPELPGERSFHWEDEAGYVTDAVVQGTWMLLAPGAGVRFVDHPFPGNWSSDMKWLPAIAPIPFDDWSATGP